MGKKSKKSNDIKIANWEYIDPLILIKAIDELMKAIEPEVKDNDIMEYIYELYFISRQNLLMMATLLKILNKKEDVESVIKNNCDSFYT